MLLIYGGRKRATVEHDSVHEPEGLAAFTPKLSQQLVLELQFSTWHNQHDAGMRKGSPTQKTKLYSLQLHNAVYMDSLKDLALPRARSEGDVSASGQSRAHRSTSSSWVRCCKYSK